MLDAKEMRDIYCDFMVEAAKTDKTICLLEADLMKSTKTQKFFELYPERSFDVGIAEANMVGVAAGLASAGLSPYCASFTPFITRRCFDQIAISVCYSNLNVKLVGTDPGICAEVNGGTHMSMEDAGIMRTLSNIAIFEPVDGVMLENALPQILQYKGPLYIRLFRKKAVKVFDTLNGRNMFEAIPLSSGKDVTIIASGIMVARAQQASAMLKEKGIEAGVLCVPSIKPLDKNAVIRAAKESGAVVTAENHNIIGALGSAVAETLAEEYPVPMQRVGVQDVFGEVGKLDYLSEKMKMRAEDIVAAAEKVIARKK